MRLDDLSPFAMQYMERYGIFVTDTPISRARMLHFQGKFPSTIEAAGALKSYMDFRVDEETLRELQYDRNTQMTLGVVKRPTESMEAFSARVSMAQNFFRKSKFDIGIFLAMANMDLGKPETAIDWLTKRLLDIRGTERWHAHAHYLLGRNYESLGNMESAIEEYKFEATPQAAGNRIRIRRLEAALNPSASPEVNE
jgi:tetratricopeptide (TPR) repeat protein